MGKSIFCASHSKPVISLYEIQWDILPSVALEYVLPASVLSYEKQTIAETVRL